MKLEIQHLYDDTYECDDCGGGVGAHGYRLIVDGEMVVERTPIDHCCSPTTYEEDDMIRDILVHVGKLKDVEIEYLPSEGYDNY